MALLCDPGFADVQQQPVFRATTDAVPLLVAATTRGGDIVSNLTVEDFEVLDNGHPAAVVAFAQPAAPVALRLLAAQTASMRGANNRAREIAHALIDLAHPGESVGISGLYDKLSGPFTDDKIALREQFDRGFQPLNRDSDYWWQSLTYAYYLLLRSVHSVAWQGAWMGSGQAIWAGGELPAVRALVVLSPGIDDSGDGNATSPRATGQRLVMSGTIAFGLSFNGKGKDKHLARLSNDSSGRHVEVTGRTNLQELAAEIWKDLRSRYLLGFVPTAFDGKAHTLAVRVKRPGVLIRARTAYLAPKTSSAAAPGPPVIGQ